MSEREPILQPKHWRMLIALAVAMATTLFGSLTAYLARKGFGPGEPPVITPVLPPEFVEGQKQQTEAIKRLEVDVLKALMQMPPAVQKQ